MRAAVRQLCAALAACLVMLAAVPVDASIDSATRNALREALVTGDEAETARIGAELRALATGDADPATRAEAWFRLGEIAEAAGDFAEAEVAYVTSRETDAGSRYAVRAEGRLRVVREALAGDSEARVAFTRLRENYATTGSEASVAEAEALLAATDDAALQADLLSFLATEELYVRSDWERARQMFLDVTQRATDDSVVIAAFHGASLSSRTFGALGDTRRRIDAWVEAHDRPGVARSLEPIRRDLIDRRGRYPAVVAFGVCGVLLLVLFLSLRGWRGFSKASRQAWSPARRVVFVAWAFGGAGFLAEGYEHGYVEAFLLCIPLVAGVVLIAGATGAVVQRDGAPRWQRMAWRVATAGATIGAVYAGMAAFGKQSVFGL